MTCHVQNFMANTHMWPSDEIRKWISYSVMHLFFFHAYLRSITLSLLAIFIITKFVDISQFTFGVYTWPDNNGNILVKKAFSLRNLVDRKLLFLMVLTVPLRIIFKNYSIWWVMFKVDHICVNLMWMEKAIEVKNRLWLICFTFSYMLYPYLTLSYLEIYLTSSSFGWYGYEWVKALCLYWIYIYHGNDPFQGR